MASKKRPFPEPTKGLLAKKPRLVNQLLDSQRFLECLKETQVTTRNATDSPLLQLPSEIRNTIWEYASSGEVELHQHAGRMPSPRKHDALPAFHLPRVCRQIHGETAILAYSLSIFTFPCYLKCKDCLDKEIFKKWTMQEHRDAITAIEPNAGFIEEYCWLQNLAEILGCRLYSTGGKLRDTYPSLRYIYVSKSVVEYVVEHPKWTSAAELLGPLRPENLKQWRKYIEGMIKSIEGEDMEVIFRD